MSELEQITTSPFQKYIDMFEQMSEEEREAWDRTVHEKDKAEKEYDRRQRLIAMMETCGLGEKFRKRTFGTFQATPENSKACEFFAVYAERFSDQKKGIYVWGSNGIGKTHLAAAVVNAIIAQGHSAYFIYVPDYKDKIYETYDFTNSETASKITAHMMNFDLVVLDDLDKLKTADKFDNTKEILCKLINKLYESERRVIITANCPVGEIAKIYDKSIASRIAEMCDIFELKGQDWRMRK